MYCYGESLDLNYYRSKRNLPSKYSWMRVSRFELLWDPKEAYAYLKCTDYPRKCPEVEIVDLLFFRKKVKGDVFITDADSV
jgi:hypothetical protein